MIPRTLTIAGSDSGGGAGIQADLKTFCAYRTYGMSAITALTAQNTVGVQGIHPVPAAFVARQIESVVSDIGVDGAKTGMLADEQIVLAVAEAIRQHGITPLVVDPVMVAKSGDRLLEEDAVRALTGEILPLSSVLTPNLPEAEVILGYDIDGLPAMKRAAHDILQMGPDAVVVKGGHLSPGEEKRRAVDVYSDGGCTEVLEGPFYATKNTHGTGCTFSAAIAAGLAHGWEARRAVRAAKDFITRAVKEGFALGSGHGPTNHFVPVHPAKEDEE